MFNVRPERLIPWLYVEPSPAVDDVPGFRIAPDGSVRDTQSIGFGVPPQEPAQPIQGVSTRGSNVLPQSVLPIDLSDVRAGPPNGVSGSNLRIKGTLPNFNLDAQTEETSWISETHS